MSPTGGILTAPPAPAPGLLSAALDRAPELPGPGLPARTLDMAPGLPSRMADTAPALLSRATGTAVRALLRAAEASPLSQIRGSEEPPLTTPRDPAREAAQRELSKRLYHEDDPGLFERAVNAVWDWVNGLFSAASTATPGGVIGLVVIILAVVAAVAALWWRLGTPRRQPAFAAILFDDRTRSAAEHRAAAEAHAAQGHWNQAVQERMRAIVRSLEERALLDVRPGRTADEAAAEAGRTLPSHRGELRAAAGDFDDVTYGGRRATEQSYRRIAELDRNLERTKPQLAHSNPHNNPHSTARNTGRGAAE